MGIGNTASFRYEVDKTIDKMFALELLRRTKYYAKYMTSKTAPAGEDYTVAGMSGLGLATTIGQGRRPNLDNPVEGNKKSRYYTKVGLSTQLTREILQDDIHGKWKEIPKQLVDSVIEKVEWDAAGVYYNGFSTSLGKDGLALFSDSHVSLKGAVTIDNLLAMDFSPSALEAAFLYGMRFRAQNGFVRPIKPKRVLVGPGNAYLMAEVQKSLGRVFIAGESAATAAGFYDAGATRINGMSSNTYLAGLPPSQMNRMNPSNGIVDRWEGLVNPYLTSAAGDDDAWFVEFEGAESDILWKWQPELTKDEDTGTQSTQYFATARYSMFCNDYEYVVGSAGV